MKQATRQKLSSGGLAGAAIGGLAAALGAASCCVLPLVLFLAGASGAWVSNLTSLSPYQPIFVGFAVLSIGFGFWRTRRAATCRSDGSCVSPLPRTVVRGALILALLLVVAAVSVPSLYPVIFG